SATAGQTYAVEVATDSGFTNIVYTANGIAGTQHTLTTGLSPVTTYYWRVQAENICGTGSYSSTFSFTTADVPPILLVDDDDNGPNVQATYTAALDALGLTYDIWDTANSDNEPDAAALSAYDVVIWFSGDEFGGFAGPGSAGETALSTWLDAGGACLFLSGQDYHYDRGMTSFMTSYLGAATITDDNGDYTSVTGQGAIFGGLGPYTLTYPFNDYSDPITPDGTAALAFQGNNSNGAAITKETADYKATFWVYPWEAITNAADRQTTLQTFFDWCAPEATAPVIEVAPTSLSSNQAPDNVVTETLTISNLGDADLTWNLFEDQTGAPTEEWSDNFDSYPTGQNLHGIGGWKGWGNSAGASASTTAAQALSAPNSVDILGASDLVHEYTGSTTGQWVYTAWQYIPNTATGQTYFILLNQYDDGGSSNNWSTQVCFDTGTNLLYDAIGTSCTGTNTLSIVYDQWVEIRVEIDLDADTQSFYYNNQLLYSDTWTGHVSGSGIANIGAVDLFANNASSVYYDDISLAPPAPAAVACDAPEDIPWLTVAPTSGTTSGGTSDDVTVTFDSTGLTSGTYTGTLCIESNDATNPLVEVPLAITVEEPTYGVALSGNQAETVLVGETVTYTLSVTNTGNASDTFDLSVASTWPATLSDTSVALDAGATTTIWVAVTVPAGTADGDADVATVTATSQADPTATDSADLTTTADVTPVYGVALSADQAASGDAGATVTYVVTITNTGNTADTFDLTVAGTWAATLSDTSVTIGAGESTTITVDVTVPADAANDDSDVTTVTATSQTDPTATDSSDLTTTATVGGGGLEIFLPIVKN
ncbi:MAG TPA: FixG Ig-like domain-containing protein, partial [Anaerolineales bacterium]|nr:FixG Ig-like domain-containing protein [Anaerolineales bacterium]